MNCKFTVILLKLLLQSEQLILAGSIDANCAYVFCQEYENYIQSDQNLATVLARLNALVAVKLVVKAAVSLADYI